LVDAINWDGDTGLILASTEGHLPIVSLLIENEANINHVNSAGRTPLMEATLWGRTAVVELLLQKNVVDSSMRDKKGKTAFDLAAPSSENSEERWHRGAPRHMEGGQLDSERQVISAKLRAVQPKESDIAMTCPPVQGFFLRSQVEQSVTYWLPESRYMVPNMGKTIARLERGQDYPVVSAMSGWGAMGRSHLVLDGRKWIPEVFRICRVLGDITPRTIPP